MLLLNFKCWQQQNSHFLCIYFCFFFCFYFLKNLRENPFHCERHSAFALFDRILQTEMKYLLVCFCIHQKYLTSCLPSSDPVCQYWSHWSEVYKSWMHHYCFFCSLILLQSKFFCSVFFSLRCVPQSGDDACSIQNISIFSIHLLNSQTFSLWQCSWVSYTFVAYGSSQIIIQYTLKQVRFHNI